MRKTSGVVVSGRLDVIEIAGVVGLQTLSELMEMLAALVIGTERFIEIDFHIVVEIVETRDLVAARQGAAAVRAAHGCVG